ncbi:ATP-dependent DNA helicase RecG [Micrococcoides hystricis]|uniref:ATP-dependent DNA helicase RecG n=1 Tax=Micrococcoides hystricis TaxID=1572761 RepID=A0ABV6PC17_9MICC
MSQPDFFTRLTEPLQNVLGTKTAQALEKELGFSTVGQLLNYRPRKWLERGELTPLDQLLVGEPATVIAEVQKVSPPRRTARGILLTKVVLGNAVGGSHQSLDLTFFNNRWIHNKLTPGETIMVHGKVSSFNGQLQMSSPEVNTDADESGQTPGPEPLYPATASLPTWRIKKSIHTVLDLVDTADVPDPVPEPIREKLSLISLSQAFQYLHRPADMEQAKAAVRRLAFHEALMIQMSLAQQRLDSAELAAQSFPAEDLSMRTSFDESLPFELTDGQREAGTLLADKLSHSYPMNVLLQGEVGAGKTLVALRAMLQVIQHGGQVVLLAPTEVLATQHLRSISAMTEGITTQNKNNTLDFSAEQPLRVVLLTGSMPTAARRQALLEIADGSADIVVGTHAVLSENVSFLNLGLVVVDEQHRFGVEQRAALRQRSEPVPHLLVMSATPIPRSIALTTFGDLEMVELAGVPANRAPVNSTVVNMAASPETILYVWQVIVDAVRQGRQAYIICPKINPTTAEGPDLGRQHDAAVEVLTARLATLPLFEGLRLGQMHGQLPAADKENIMRAFERHEIDVLVSTTVVEVGVDVPNATVMVVLDADSFGISTLHQLRGRIRRSEHPGTFIMVHRRDETDQATAPTLRRLNAVAETTDGMELAIEDLNLRKEGDILGVDQSGRGSSLRFLRLRQDTKLISAAHDLAAQILSADVGEKIVDVLNSWMTLWQQDYAAEYLHHG